LANNNNNGIGLLGVLVGALVVILVGGGILFATGNLGGSGGSQPTVNIEAPTTTGSGSTTAPKSSDSGPPSHPEREHSRREHHPSREHSGREHPR
jgi:hypothetical protein